MVSERRFITKTQNAPLNFATSNLILYLNLNLTCSWNFLKQGVE